MYIRQSCADDWEVTSKNYQINGQNLPITINTKKDEK